MEAIQELNERKTKILHAIIKNYLETGEPVGSRTISKYTDLNLSSATIRNEMADLEELGYIMQPHTSAGRIPSDKGYRWYVDMLMSQKEQEITEIKGQMLEKADKMEELLKQVAKVLANNTNYATMISTPTYNGNKLKFIQLSQVDDHQLIVVIVMEGNIVKNQIVTLDEPLSNEALLKLNMLLNTSLNGTSLEQINLGVIARLKEQAGIHSGVMSSVLDAVANVIQLDDDMEIYTSGATNIFKYPELSDDEILSILHCVSAAKITRPRGSYIFRAGDSTEVMGLMLSGSTLVIQEDLWGHRNILSKCNTGDFFGEPYAATPGAILNISVVAEEDCEILLLNVKRLLTSCPTACDHHQKLIRNLVSVLANKILLFNDKITHVSKRTTREKLLSYLSAESIRQSSLSFDIPFDRQQLADFLCVERAAMSAELSKLQKEGLLVTKRNHFELLTR